MVELAAAAALEVEHLEGWTRWRWKKGANELFASRNAGIDIRPLLSTGRFVDPFLPALYSSLHSIDLAHSPSGSLLPANRSFKQTVMIHDLAFLNLPGTKPPEETAFWKRRVHDAVRSADGILVNSRCTFDDLISSFPEAEGKTWVTTLGIDHLRSRIKADPSTGDHILAVGTVEPRKNIPTLVKAYEELNASMDDLPELIVAGGMGYRSREILLQAGNSPAAAKIKFTGYVSEAELNDLYRRSVCLVHPALYEGFGFTVPEALGFGLPVVCSNNSALAELYSDSAYLVDPLDHISLADGIAMALKQGLTERARQATEKLFEELTWENCARASIRAFRKVLG